MHTNGSLGYASFVEMNGCDPVTRKKVEGSAAYKGGAIPVYDSEGDIIGEFVIEEGKSGGVPGDFSTPEEAREAVANGWPDNQ